MEIIGLGVALVTPFLTENKIDIPALEKITRHIIDGGANYIVVLGTTAETVNLSGEEKRLVIDTVVKINAGRIPLILGIGGYSTEHVINEMKDSGLKGISAILSVCPYYNKPNQEGIYNHFKAISAASPLPLVLYNVPSRTATNMEAETTLRLANDFSNIVAIKEASGNIPQISNIIKNKPDHFSVISGDDIYTLPLMSIGATGVISVIGNAFPSEFSAMIHAARQDNWEKARTIHHKMADFIHFAFLEGSPAGIKGLLSVMGFCSAKVRLPLWELSQETTKQFEKLLKQH